MSGTTWTDREQGLNGFDGLTFEFQANNRVTMRDAKQTVTGTWYKSGNGVHLTFFNGNCDYYGTIENGRMSGRADANRRTWTWDVSQKAR